MSARNRIEGKTTMEETRYAKIDGPSATSNSEIRWRLNSNSDKLWLLANCTVPVPSQVAFAASLICQVSFVYRTIGNASSLP